MLADLKPSPQNHAKNIKKLKKQSRMQNYRNAEIRIFVTDSVFQTSLQKCRSGELECRLSELL